MSMYKQQCVLTRYQINNSQLLMDQPLPDKDRSLTIPSLVPRLPSPGYEKPAFRTRRGKPGDEATLYQEAVH